jgi:hypothetical protein
MEMKIVSSREPLRLDWRGTGKDRADSGLVEAVREFGLGCVIEPICVAPSIVFDGLVARDGV